MTTWYCSCKVCGIGMIVPGNDETEAQFKWGQIHASQCSELQKFVSREMKILNDKIVEKFLSMRRES